MPFSQTTQLSAIMGFIEGLKPNSILDVGTGMGQYGFLARTNLEHVNLFIIDGAHVEQRPKADWKIRIDGVEAFPTYVTPVHDYVYNQMHIGDALNVLPTLSDKDYELVMAIDILEHFEKEEGLFFLEQLKRLSCKSVLVSTPKEFIHQEVEANPYENHRSFWMKDDLKNAGFTQFIENGESWIAVYSVA